MDVEKSQRVLPFSFFPALWDFSKKIPTKGSPLNFFWSFATKCMLKNPKGSSLSVFFSIVRLFKKNPHERVSPQFFSILQMNGCSKTPKGSTFTFSALCDLPETKKKQKNEKKIRIFFSIFPSRGYCRRENLTLWSSFAIFELWIWRRLGPFPACWRYIWIQSFYIAYKRKGFLYICIVRLKNL